MTELPTEKDLDWPITGGFQAQPVNYLMVL